MYGSLSLSLNDQRPWQHLIAVDNIADSQTDEITAAQFAVDGEVEQCEIADSMSVLKVHPDGPNVFGPQRRFLAPDRYDGNRVCMVAHPLMAEAAVVGGADEVTGQAICTGEEARQPAAKLRKWVGEQIGAIAKPRHIRVGDTLPKTRSRRIMRRLPRFLAKGEKVTQDVSTLENLSVLDQLGEAFQRQHGKANAVRSTKVLHSL